MKGLLDFLLSIVGVPSRGSFEDAPAPKAVPTSAQQDAAYEAQVKQLQARPMPISRDELNDTDWN